MMRDHYVCTTAMREESGTVCGCDEWDVPKSVRDGME